MPRPRKKYSEKLTAVLPPIRCTKAEKESIKEKAKAAQLSMSEYVRQKAISGKVIKVDSELNLEMVEQLRRIGINLNQQTRRLNTTGNMPLQLSSVWDRLEIALDKLIEKLS